MFMGRKERLTEAEKKHPQLFVEKLLTLSRRTRLKLRFGETESKLEVLLILKIVLREA